MFVNKTVMNTVPRTCVINNFSIDEFVEIFYKEELQKAHQKKFRAEKAIKKCDTLYVIWKGYNKLQLD